MLVYTTILIIKKKFISNLEIIGSKIKKCIPRLWVFCQMLITLMF